MGTFKVKAKVWNPSKLDNVLDVELIVDTGATYTVLPAKTLERLGIEAVRTARLDDKRVIERPIGEIGIEIERRKASATQLSLERRMSIS